MGKLTMINKIKNENLIKQNKGQIAIIVLLASAIVLTLGLSASKTAVTDTKVDTDEELLKEAFNTAESAINNYLIDSTKINYTTEGSGASIVSTQIGGEDIKEISSEGVVSANTSQLFWLVDHDDIGKIGTNYYQGDSIKVKVDDDFTGALKIDYFYKNGITYSVTRSGYNFNSANPIVNNFINTTLKEIEIATDTGDPLLLAITPLGSATSLTISNSSFPFPSQGEEITAASSTENGVKTQIKTRYIYQFPSFMLDAITAKGTIQ